MCQQRTQIMPLAWFFLIYEAHMIMLHPVILDCQPLRFQQAGSAPHVSSWGSSTCMILCMILCAVLSLQENPWVQIMECLSGLPRLASLAFLVSNSPNYYLFFFFFKRNWQITSSYAGSYFILMRRNPHLSQRREGTKNERDLMKGLHVIFQAKLKSTQEIPGSVRN